MILSFSVPTMRPMIEAGLRQRSGEDVGQARVKRQSIRADGPRAERLLHYAKLAGWTIPYDLHLWWKSRTKERAQLGVVSGAPLHVYPIEILHSTVVPPNDPEYQCLRIVLPKAARSRGLSDLMWWSPGNGGTEFTAFARADGFDSVEAFRDFFVPNCGDRFRGILYTW